MELSEGRLNRATLARQLLLDRNDLDVVAATHQVLALQAQEPASPYVALWARIRNFDPAVLDAAIADDLILKSTLMRATLHAVDARDYARFRTAVHAMLRSAALRDSRFPTLDEHDANALVPVVLEHGAQPRTGREYEALLAAHTGAEADAGLWRALRLMAPLVHAVTGGPWSFGPRPVLRASPVLPAGEPDECTRYLAERYLAAFGPASVLDFAQFTKLTRPVARAALSSVPGVIEHRGPDGTVLLDLPDAPLPPARTPAPPRLLGMWDSVVLAHADRSRVMSAEHRALVIRTNGDTLPVLLVDGRVVGVWRPIGDDSGNEPDDVRIEVTAFQDLPARAWTGVRAEAESLANLLAGRDPAAYRRYRRWWAGLPAQEVRVLGG